MVSTNKKVFIGILAYFIKPVMVINFERKCKVSIQSKEMLERRSI
jgi:hypothetical protein